VRLVRFLGHSPVAFLVLGIGVFNLALAALLHYYVLPRVALMPLDVHMTSVSSGTGSYFDQTTLTVKGPVTMTLTTHVVGDVAAGEATGHAVWNISTRVDTPDTAALPDPRSAYNWTLQRVVSERHSGAIVNCCGAKPPVDLDAHNTRYPFVYLQFPFNAAKTTYDYWNPQLGKVFPVRFAGTTTMDGHELYRFTGTVPATKIGAQQVPGALIGLPDQPGLLDVDVTYRDDGVELVVDPTTGAPVRTSQHVATTFRQPGSTVDRLTVLSADVTTTEASQEAVLKTAIDGGRQLRLLGETLPAGMLWVGAVLTLAGAGLAVRSARRPNRMAT
jgi:hypothetical protein